MSQRPVDKATWEKLRRKDRACVGIAAFWRGNQENGFNMTIENSPDSPVGELDAILEEIDACVLFWASMQPPPEPDDLIHYIARVAETKTKKQIEILHAVAMVAYLEEKGAIASDEFNGIIYMYRVGENTFEIERSG
jgi:hypothetical protein